tara:strand:+ start:208 stop:447 length:240 start_codon:yes stop_codon:yes gene_type:complete
MSDKKLSIHKLLTQLEGVDKKICNLSEKLKLIKQMVNDKCDEESEEVCPDVVDSDRAIVEAIEKLYVEELITRDPEGDA